MLERDAQGRVHRQATTGPNDVWGKKSLSQKRQQP